MEDGPIVVRLEPDRRRVPHEENCDLQRNHAARVHL